MKSNYHRQNPDYTQSKREKHFKQMDKSKFGKLKKKNGWFYMMFTFRVSITWPKFQYAFTFSNYKRCLFGTP